MLTFEKVLDAFKDYLAADDMFEVVLTHHGYALLAWDERAKDWVDINTCPTPEDLRDALMDGYENCIEYHITYGKRKLTEADKATIQEKLQAMRTQLGE